MSDLSRAFTVTLFKSLSWVTFAVPLPILASESFSILLIATVPPTAIEVSVPATAPALTPIILELLSAFTSISPFTVWLAILPP